jgi:adenylate kinase
LVQNLDQYCQSNSALFDEVVKTIEEEFVHIIRRQALIGNCIIRSVNRIFDEPLAVDMFLDVMIERGFTVTLDVQKVDIPVKIHPETFEIFTKTKKIFHFHIRFPTPTIRSL